MQNKKGCNTWSRACVVNWKLVTITFIWSGFLLLALLDKSNFYPSKLEQDKACTRSWRFLLLKFLTAYFYLKFS